MKTLSLLAAILISTQAVANDHVKVTTIMLTERDSRLCLADFDTLGKESINCQRLSNGINEMKKIGRSEMISLAFRYDLSEVLTSLTDNLVAITGKGGK